MAVLALGAGPSPAPRDRLRLPPIVFVSRQPIPGDPYAVPGLGPHQRATITGGRLMLREPDGRVRELLPPGEFADVSDPAVSPNGTRLAFAAVTASDSSWRIYVMTLGDPLGLVWDPPALGARFPERHDDLDPIWLSDSLLCLASSAGSTRAQYAGAPTTQLFVIPIGSPAAPAVGQPAPVRITAERNGADEPALDRRSGRIVYARWWFNRWRPSLEDARGITADPTHALAADSVNLWQIVSARIDGSDERLEASGLRSRLASMGAEPAVLSDGSIVVTYASNLGLSPRPGVLGLQRFSPRLGHATRLVGAIVEAVGDGYGSPQGLAAPSACSPAALPDGRILFSYAPGGRGDFGLFVMNAEGSHIEPVFDQPGTLELNAVAVAAWRAPKASRAPATAAAPAGAGRGSASDGAGIPDLLARSRAELEARGTFRFLDRNVFGGGRSRPGVHAAPPRGDGVRIRFFTALARSGGGTPDSAILLRETTLRPDGSVDVRLPANTPMFEQLVDAHGHVLRSADGPAHVAGYNSGRPNATVRCVGCHTGHSIVPVQAGPPQH